MMATQTRIARWLRVLCTLALVLLAPLSAWAGTLQIKDSEGLLSPGDAAALRHEGNDYPFDVRVVTTAEHPDKADLDRYVHEQLAAPNMVVVGVDKAHRHTAVHFGTSTGVPAGEFRAVEQAGNGAFREGNWRAGITAILNQARAVARPSGSLEPSAGAGLAPASDRAASPARASASTAMWGLLVVLIVAGLIVFVGVTLSRRARSGMLGVQPPNGGYPPGAGLGGYPNGPYPPGGYPPAGYPPGYGYAPGGYAPGGGLGRNIAAAGVGGLVGYELGKLAGEHEGRRDFGHESSDMYGTSSGEDRTEQSPDAGGAAGGWDDGASQGADSDWGSDSSSDGGDWGGGDSGDSGGGGSDW